MAHGAGGKASRRLVEGLFAPLLFLSSSEPLGDAAHLDFNGTRIAITTDKRLPQLSDVPTVNESYPDFGSFEAWLMIVAPANTPPDIVQRMSAEIARAGNSQELRDLFEVYPVASLGLIQEVLPLLRAANDGGRVVLI